MDVNLRPDFVGPSCQVQAGVGPTFSANQGFASVVRNGPGDYTLTLGNPFDTTGAVLLCSASGGTPVSLCANVLSPTSIRVLTLDGTAGAGLGLPIDAGFGLLITRA